MPNPFLLLFLLLSTELRLCFLLLGFLQVQAELLRLVHYTLSQNRIPILLDKLLISLFQVRDNSFPDNRRLQKLKNRGPIFLFFLQHFFD